MKIGAKRYRKLLWLLLAFLAIVLVPYGCSRVASSWRCVTVHSLDATKPDRKETSAIRIVSYNIAHGRGLATSNWEGGTRDERKARLDRIAEMLNKLDADIVVLNEVDFDSSWSFSTNQARYLAKQAGYPYWVEQRNLDFRVLVWTWRFGNAVLSKYPITESSVVDLPGYSIAETVLGGKKRGVICRVDVKGEKVRVLAAHLSHRSEALRVHSARVITTMVSGGKIPTIVAGDLNSTPTGFPYSQLDKDGENALDILDDSSVFQRRPEEPPSDPDELTYSSTQPTSAIDWILVPRDYRLLGYRVEASTLSDHRPIVADLSLPATEKRRTVGSQKE